VIVHRAPSERLDRYGLKSDWRRHATKEQWARLLELLDAANFWNAKDDDPCSLTIRDGTYWAIEGVRDGKRKRLGCEFNPSSLAVECIRYQRVAEYVMGLAGLTCTGRCCLNKDERQNPDLMPALQANGMIPKCPSMELSIEEVVRLLGTRKDPDPSCSLERLHLDGHRSAAALVRELRVVNPDPHTEDHDRWWHGVWCERALRSLTGERFEFAPVDHRIRVADCAGPVEHCPYRFIDFDGEPLPFFAEWMSRARVYVSPRDVQQSVIDAWTAWHAEHGETFRPRPYEQYGPWYW
jgi:hypothetical protein